MGTMMCIVFVPDDGDFHVLHQFEMLAVVVLGGWTAGLSSAPGLHGWMMTFIFS